MCYSTPIERLPFVGHEPLFVGHFVYDAWPVRRQTIRFAYLPSDRASPPFEADRPGLEPRTRAKLVIILDSSSQKMI